MNRMEVARRATALGVPEDQVRRDELISHVLAGVDVLDQLVFFGGTALCRTHLPDLRLSEDIDLLATDPAGARDALSEEAPRALRRMYPGSTLTWQRDGTTWVGWLRTSDGLTIRVQVVPLDDSYRRYPVRRVPVDLRYSGLPRHRELTVPTAAGVTAMKLNAWAHRHAPRDLCDLGGLHGAGHLDVHALEIAGDVSSALQPHSFGMDALPTKETWQAALGAQMQPLPDRHLAFHTVRTKVATLSGWPQARHWSDALERLEEDRNLDRIVEQQRHDS